MALIIPNYESTERVVMVQADTATITASPEDTLLLSGSAITIQATGISYDLDSFAERFECDLHTGDIIHISGNGFVYKMFGSGDTDATVFLTGQCNSNCIMCPCSDHERRFNTGYSDELISKFIELLPSGLPHIVVTGGEPTLKTEQFFKVMSQLADKFPTSSVLLLTNGRSLASKAMVDRLLDHCPPYMEVAIPIHGHTAELHDKISRAENSFKHTLMGIRNLLSNGIPVELRIVVSKLNVAYLFDIACLVACSLPGVRIVNFIGLEALGNCAKNFKQVYMPYPETFQFIKPALKILADSGIDASLYNYPLCTVERGYWTLCKQSITPYKVRYAPACDECEAKPFCGGYFSSTLGVAKPEVFPIHF